MNLVIVGPPGAGKGTQGKVIARRFQIRHLVTGDILRQEIREGSGVGEEARSYVESGALVPDDLIIQMMIPHIESAVRDGGFILDGFPRTLVQLDAVNGCLEDRGIKLDGVVSIDVDDETLVSRLGDRRICPECHKVYHLKNNPPREAGRCDQCETALVTRDDDRREVVTHRLAVYREQTQPVIEAYRGMGLVVDVNGRGSIDAIADRIAGAMRKG